MTLLRKWFLMGHFWREAKIVPGYVLVPILFSREELVEKIRKAA